MPLYMKITPLTVYSKDNTIFAGLVENLPSVNFPRADEYEDLYLTAWQLNSETLVNNLLLETANLNVLYTNPDFLKFAIKTWSEKQKAIWQSLFETLFYKYNPIWNKDGTYKETATETRNLLAGNTRTITNNGDILDTDDTLNTKNLLDTNGGTLTTQNSKSETITDDKEKHNTGTVGESRNSTTTNQVAAYNAALTDRDKSTTTDSNTRTDNLTETEDNTQTASGTGTETQTDTRTLTQTGTDRNERDYHRVTSESGSITDSGSDSGTIGNDIERRDYGNIGVTKTQEMIKDERDIVKFNIYDYIIDDFKHKFCIMLY